MNPKKTISHKSQSDLFVKKQDDLFAGKPPTIVTNYKPESEVIMLEGDSLESLKNVPSNSIQLIISSPPYNIGKEYETEKNLNLYLEEITPILQELYRILTREGSICWQVGNYIHKREVFPLDIYYYPIFKAMGLKMRNRVIWHFGHGLHCSKRFSGRYETLSWFTKSDSYVFNLDSVRIPSKYPGKTNYKKGGNYGKPSGNPLGKNPSDFWETIEKDWESLVWEIPNVKSNHPEKTEHPCQFPIELVQRCVLAFTNEGDQVLDPFGGVGSVAIAAAMSNRKSIICEKEKEYLDIAKTRLKDYYSGDLKIRPLGKPIHKPSGREKVSQIPAEWENNNGDYRK